MKLKRRYVALAGTVAASALTAALFLAPATANASVDQCPNGYFCVWEHANFSGRVMVIGGDMADLFTPMSGLAGTTTSGAPRCPFLRARATPISARSTIRRAPLGVASSKGLACEITSES